MSQTQRQEDFLRRRNHEADRLTPTATAASSSAAPGADSPSLSPRPNSLDKNPTRPDHSSVQSGRHHPQTGSPSQYGTLNSFRSAASSVTRENAEDQTSDAARQRLGLEGGSAGSAVTNPSAVRGISNSSRNAVLQTRPSPDLSSTHSRQGPASLTTSSMKSAFSRVETQPQRVIMPRTSSIDSAISSVSTTSHPPKPLVDMKEPSQEEVHQLIEAAGSPEILVLHLLKEKQNAVSQNAQLWKLVDKQRALVLGLNKDLERLTKEKDRYRKKLKETQGQIPQPPLHVVRKDSQSPVRNGSTTTTIMEKKDTAGLSTPDIRPHGQLESSPIDPAMMPSPLHLQQLQARQPQPQLTRQDTQETQESDSSVECSEETRAKAVQPKDIFPVPVVISEPEPETNLPREEIQPLHTMSFASASTGTRQPPKMPTVQTSLGPPSLNLIEPSPLADKPNKSFSSARKAPAPLNLKQSALAQTVRAGELTEPAFEEEPDTNESPQPGRGRRKTREEDDRDRELATLQEQQARSLSKKEKRSETRPDDIQPEIKETQLLPPNLPSIGLPASPRHPPPAISDRLSPPSHVSSNLPSVTQDPGATTERMLIAPLRSPGLPTSPRPGARPMGSPLPRNPKDNASLRNVLPLSPRGGMPLSPRAPNKPIPLPPGAQLVATALAPQASAEPHTQQEVKSSNITERTMSPTEPPPIYRGLVSPAHPDLLLPPNALPSIEVKVASSRLRPSYGSSNESGGAKTQEDTAVFSLSIFSRSNREELWRIEKSTIALPQLDYALRPLCNNLPRVPERKLFNGHAPAVMDARRNSINTYFDELLDTPMDEHTASVICQFLSTDTIDPGRNLDIINDAQSSAPTGSKMVLKKTGYLTKRGKNFGGWKSRYYVLGGTDLRCFESPGGQHLSTIKLLNAQIGKQSQSGSPQLPPDEADENQYRHAFLILEPKKKDSSSLMRHVLCAENDAERDEWVEALLHHVDGSAGDSSGATSVPEDSGRLHENEDVALKAVNYADTVAGLSPVVTAPTPHKTTGYTITPPSVSSPTFTNFSNHDHVTTKSVISGPTNGAVISDAGSWGNKPATQTKEHKKRSMFHFRQKPSTDSVSSQPFVNSDSHHSRPADHYNGPHVFGLPLAEAVEFCGPIGVNVHLPAVVYRCIEYLRAKNAATEEGIFRLSGSNLVIRTLKERFNTEGDVDFLADDHYYDVHAVASLFKTYLRELPSTVLTRDLHLDFLHVLELEDNASKIAAFNTLVHRLPSVNYSLLRTLSQFLLEVVQNSDQNKMSVRNVGIVFSPTLNIPAPVFAMFLTEFDAIFGEKVAPEDQPRRVELTVPRSLSPEDIRSPRHQMFSDLSTPAYNQNAFPPTPSGTQASPTSSAEDVGFTPLQQPYETSRNLPVQQAAPSHHPWQPFPQQPSADAAYGSLNRMIAPANAPNAKAKRRESSMLFM